jgi:short-subunit dehydrogenase
MPVIAIVGAGQGLGLSIARRFGREGFAVALISRSAANLGTLTAELRRTGIEAAGFEADVRDRPALAGRGVYVAHVPLAVYIGSGGPQTQPDTIAELYWDLYLTRDQPERLYSWR